MEKKEKESVTGVENKWEHEKGKAPVLEVEDLTVSFGMYYKGLRRRELEVLHRLSLTVYAGEILAVIGASGSGKSVLAHAVLGILPGNAAVQGEMRYQGGAYGEKEQKRLRGKEIVLIPQSVDYLDPLMRVGRQVRGVRGSKKMQENVFERYGLSENVDRLYPWELSGGMARRVLISAAEMEKARLVVADEPTPGLNEEMAEETMKSFRQMAERGCGVLLITHDIDLAFRSADRIAVFYAGTVVEEALTEDFQSGGAALRHPYSRAFLDALPQNGFRPIPGSQPYAGNLPKGCLFADRCPMRSEACGREIKMREVRGGRVRCIRDEI